ncbi:nuclear transport factor 2 family protein [Chitinophaga sp.]|uniref:nuclear transport factor 2 family protein n=1 Tax=Chitinophaga sp. TaxID=1869181 RepID=UPI0031DE4D24
MKKVALSDSNEMQVKRVIDDWCQAIRDINYENLLSNHADDVLMFDVPPPLQSKGLDQYKKAWDLFFQYSSGGEGSFQLEELQITAGEDVAFCTALLAIGKGRKPECRLTVGLKKIDGRWLITHEHHSAPAPIS